MTNGLALSTQTFVSWHKWQAYDGLRLGQRFCNTYIKYPWTELYYQINEGEAILMIDKWMTDHQYDDVLPHPLPNGGQPVPTYPNTKVHRSTGSKSA